MLGLMECKCLSSPGSKDEEKGEGELLDDMDRTAYRAMAARANYLALDRPDLQFAAKEVCRSMQNPTTTDWNKLKRMVRYIGI